MEALKKQMEALVLGLIALTLQKGREKLVPEPAEFRPFDLQALEQLYTARDNSPSRPSDRRRPYAATGRREYPPAVPFSFPNN